MIERADLVILAPSAPVRELLGGLLDRPSADFDVHGSPRPKTRPTQPAEAEFARRPNAESRYYTLPSPGKSCAFSNGTITSL
jgi:hypothetical protein